MRASEGGWPKTPEDLKQKVLQPVFIDVDRDDPSDATAAWSVVYNRPPASTAVAGRPKPSGYMPHPGPSPIRTTRSVKSLPQRQHDSGPVPQPSRANKSSISVDLAATTNNRNDRNDDRTNSAPGESDGQSASIQSEQSDLDKTEDSFSDHEPKGPQNPIMLIAPQRGGDQTPLMPLARLVR